MPDLRDGQTQIVRGSTGSPYEIKNVGGVYSCSCTSWRNQSRNPAYRTCKHLLDYRGDAVEAGRILPGGRVNMPGTVASRVERYWPRAGVAAVPSPAPAPGGRAMRHETTVTKLAPKAAPKVAPKPAAPHNAWTALLDDDHPLAEPLPPPPPPAPANDSVEAKAAASDEPEWESRVELVRAEGDAAPEPIHAGGSAAAFKGVLLAHPWDGARNVVGWLMSEKLDGIRAYWDGRTFLSRNGNVFETPAWYREGMPKGHHLDGELWMGHGRFQETSGYVRRMDAHERWKDITYQVFDAPSVKGKFTERLAAIGTDIILPSHAIKLAHRPVVSIDDLKAFVFAVEAKGGEGGMVRDPNSQYVRGRHESLLKVKSFFETEAIIYGRQPGKGRHVGAIGAFECIIPADVTLRAGGKTCHLKRGTRFEVGTGQSDRDRELNNPRAADGCMITFRFQELSKDGIPRFPSFVGYRDYE